MYNVSNIIRNVPINIYALRKEHQMSAKQLAEIIGKSECTVTAWERAEKKPSLESLIKICNVFDCTLEEFFNAKVSKKKEK